MLFYRFLAGYYPINSYIIGCEKAKEAVLVDPGGYELQINEFLQRYDLTLKKIVITHAHGDHVGGLEDLRDATKAEVFMHELELQDLSNSLLMPDCRGLVDHFVKEGDEIPFGRFVLKVLETPGHSPGMVCYYIKDKVMVGDTLFAGSVGGTSSKENFDREVQAIKSKIFPLGDHVKIYPAHGPSTTVEIERLYNPFLNI